MMNRFLALPLLVGLKTLPSKSTLKERVSGDALRSLLPCHLDVLQKARFCLVA